MAEGGSRRPVERSDGHLAARLLLVRHRAQHGRPHLALRQVHFDGFFNFQLFAKVFPAQNYS